VKNHYRVLHDVRPDIEDVKDGEGSLKDEIVVSIGGPSVFLGRERFAVLQERLRECRYVIFIHDDYLAYPATQIRTAIMGKPNVVLSHVRGLPMQRKIWSFATEYHYIPINQAAWRPLPFKDVEHKGLLYYGWARPGRLEQLSKYLCTQLYPVYLACSKYSREKFAEEGIIPSYVGKFNNMPYDLQGYEASLYLEDEQTKMQVDPACRLFECISAGVALFFLCQPHGINVRREWMVDSPEELARKLPFSEEIRHAQREAFATRDWYGEILQRPDEVLPR